MSRICVVQKKTFAIGSAIACDNKKAGATVNSVAMSSRVYCSSVDDEMMALEFVNSSVKNTMPQIMHEFLFF